MLSGLRSVQTSGRGAKSKVSVDMRSKDGRTKDGRSENEWLPVVSHPAHDWTDTSMLLYQVVCISLVR